MKISANDIELDKIPGAWVLTYWFCDGHDVRTALRLKIDHASFEEPNHVEAEIRFGRCAPFIRIHAFETSGYEAAHPDRCANAWDDLPSVFTDEFKGMLQVWGALSELVSVGSTWAERYANEPADSRDVYDLQLDNRPCANRH